jgi:pimeloyl-ACP methyl ester carboxylesterase
VTVTVVHGRIELALHELRAGDGRPLLRLHGLGLRSPGTVPDELAGWPGPVWALDFTGHGASTISHGGGYTCEVLMGDVDAALEHLSRSTLVGYGLGAYVALLAAGGRPDAARGAILCDGSGLTGGGPQPGSPSVAPVDRGGPVPPDPFALVELSRDVRPADYATSFARLAVMTSDLPNPIAVCAKARPEWLRAVVEEPGVLSTTLEEALGVYASGP